MNAKILFSSLFDTGKRSILARLHVSEKVEQARTGLNSSPNPTSLAESVPMAESPRTISS